jgi:hypothetical protein
MTEQAHALADQRTGGEREQEPQQRDEKKRHAFTWPVPLQKTQR